MSLYSTLGRSGGIGPPPERDQSRGRVACRISCSRAGRCAASWTVRIDELLEEMDELKRSVRILGKAMPSKTQESGGSLYAELVSQGIDQILPIDL